jgi:hypothetical protein
MLRRRFLAGGAVALAAALSGCAQTGGSDPVEFDRMMIVTKEETSKMLGVWRGPCTPLTKGGVPGEAELNVTEIDGTLMRAKMTWYRDGEYWYDQDITAALAQGEFGHYNFLSSHAMVHERGPLTYMIVDTYLKDGHLYRIEVGRTDISFETEAPFQHH